jgi:hypothetical protein
MPDKSAEPIQKQVEIALNSVAQLRAPAHLGYYLALFTRPGFSDSVILRV